MYFMKRSLLWRIPNLFAAFAVFKKKFAAFEKTLFKLTLDERS